MSPLKIAFIGGSIESAVGKTHAIATQMDNAFALIAGCFSTNKEVNHASALAYQSQNNIKIYDNYIALLENEKGNIDAIAVLTPTTSHKEIIIEALLNGYAVISEKALCTSTKEALEIYKILQNKNGFLAITYNYTGYHMIREMREMIANGEFGKIFSIHVEMPQEGFIRDNANPQKWRLKDSDIPIISLDLGIHCHNLITFLTQKNITHCIAMQGSYGHFPIVDDVNVLAKCDDLTQINMWFSKSALGFRNGLKIRIYGEKLSAEWIQTNPEIITIANKAGEITIKDRASNICLKAKEGRYNRFKAGHPSGFIEAFANYYSDIANALKEYKQIGTHANPYIFGIDESIQNLAFFECVSHSAKTQKLEKVPILNEIKEKL